MSKLVKKSKTIKYSNKMNENNQDTPLERKCGYYQVNPDVTTIYVGNLIYKKTEKQVQELFGRYGSVKYAKIVLDPKTGKGKGIGFVQMPNKKHANEAIKDLNGKNIDGRTLKVSIAEERDPEKFSKAPQTYKKKAKETKSEEDLNTKPKKRKRDKGLKVLFNHLVK